MSPRGCRDSGRSAAAITDFLWDKRTGLAARTMPHPRRYHSSERGSRGSYHEHYRSRKHKRRRSRSWSSSSDRTRRRRREDSYHVRSRSSYDDRSSDRRAYDRRYCGSYRRNDYSRERADAYYDADYRHSYEYHRENSSYRSQRSSRRKHRRRRRHSRTFSRSSSVSASPALCPHPLLQPSGTPVSDKYPCAQRSSRAWTQVAAESVCSPGSSLALGGPWHLLWRWMGTGRCEPRCPPRHAGLVLGAAPPPEACILSGGPCL